MLYYKVAKFKLFRDLGGHEMDIKQHVGMRTLKTGIAVVITACLGNTFLISNPFYAVIGTVFAMQNTVKSSFVAGKNRFLGTVLGAIIGYLFALVHFDHPFYLGFAVIVTIICCNALKISSSIIIAATVCISILMGITADQNPLIYSLLRTTDTSIGIIVGILVNYFIAQPNYLGRLTDEIEKIEQMTIELVKNILIHQDLNISPLNSELSRLNALYHNYCADTKFHKNPVSSKKLKKSIDACHDIYFHAKCIAKLELEQTEMTFDNKMEIIEFFNQGCQEKVKLREPIHPIFEYHIHKMLDQIYLLTSTVEDLTEHLNPTQE